MDQRSKIYPTFDPSLYKEFKVCDLCSGTGKHVNPSIDENGITGEEMLELGDEFQDMYFSGGFDIKCRKCNGLRIVPDNEEYEERIDNLEEHNREREIELRFGY